MTSWFAARAALAAALALSVGTSALAADPTAGKIYFAQRCTMCHVVTPGAKGMMAPNLYGIGGTMSGVGDFAFSNALKNARLKWNAETLDAFLTAPSKVAPGTRMLTPIPDAAARANVVAFLLSLHH